MRILLRGFARVGIIALIDEAAGCQKDRARDALADISEQFIAKEPRPYIRIFPGEFYKNLFRLRGLEFPRDSGKKPQYFGHLTNDIVWARLAPGVLEEMRTIIAKRGGLDHFLFWRSIDHNVDGDGVPRHPPQG